MTGFDRDRYQHHSRAGGNRGWRCRRHGQTSGLQRGNQPTGRRPPSRHRQRQRHRHRRRCRPGGGGESGGVRRDVGGSAFVHVRREQDFLAPKYVPAAASEVSFFLRLGLRILWTPRPTLSCEKCRTAVCRRVCPVVVAFRGGRCRRL